MVSVRLTPTDSGHQRLPSPAHVRGPRHRRGCCREHQDRGPCHGEFTPRVWTLMLRPPPAERGAARVVESRAVHRASMSAWCPCCCPQQAVLVIDRDAEARAKAEEERLAREAAERRRRAKRRRKEVHDTVVRARQSVLEAQGKLHTEAASAAQAKREFATAPFSARQEAEARHSSDRVPGQAAAARAPAPAPSAARPEPGVEPPHPAREPGDDLPAVPPRRQARLPANA